MYKNNDLPKNKNPLNTGLKYEQNYFEFSHLSYCPIKAL